MTLDRIIMIGLWIIMSVLLILTVPRIKIREAFVIFSFKQMQTWLLGLLVVQYNLLEYPVREFANAARNSFSFEYFIYPVVATLHLMVGLPCSGKTTLARQLKTYLASLH